MDGESSPLNWGSVEVSIFYVQISGAHCLRTETIEQGNFGTAGHANWKKKMFLLKRFNLFEIQKILGELHFQS